jgi:hypothetical protein
MHFGFLVKIVLAYLWKPSRQACTPRYTNWSVVDPSGLKLEQNSIWVAILLIMYYFTNKQDPSKILVEIYVLLVT